MAYDAVIFDIDNVLIDTTMSFPMVIRTSLQWIWKFYLQRNNDCIAFTMDHFRLMKSYPYFNDDYDISWILSNIAASSENQSLVRSFPSREKLKEILDTFDGENLSEWVKKKFGNRVERKFVRKLCSELYYGSEIFTKISQKAPSFVKCSGFWKAEKPFIDTSWHQLKLPSGIYTGRCKYELELALTLLGWEDFPPSLVITADQGICKPSSKGLEIICERLKSRNPLYFGDAESDRKSMKNLGYGTFVGIGHIMKDNPLHFADTRTALKKLGII